MVPRTMSDIKYSVWFAALPIVMGLLLTAVSGLNTLAGRYVPRQPMLPPKYVKPPHTAQQVDEENGKYVYHYTFKDHHNATTIWTWKINKQTRDRAARQFGLPPSIFTPYEASSQIIQNRNAQIQSGMFKYDGGYLVPDVQTLVNYHLPMMRPLYRLLTTVANNESLNKRGRLKLLMRFCQDIPYGVPPNTYEDKIIAGLFTPPYLLNNAWGDCDSKCLLFSSILLHDPSYKIVLIQSPGHTSLGIKDVPRPYETSVHYKGEDYVLCEPVGPRRSDLGVPQNDYFKVESITEVYPWPETLEHARKTDVHAEFAFRQTGHTLKILLAQNGNIINSKNFKLFQNDSGFDKSFYKINNMPDEKGVYYINTESKRIYLMMKRPGYYIYKSLDDLSRYAEKNIVFVFDPDKCLYIIAQPNQDIYIFKKEDNGYSGKKCRADAQGIIRLICDPGLYDISSSATLSGKLFKIDYFAGIGATVKT